MTSLPTPLRADADAGESLTPSTGVPGGVGSQSYCVYLPDPPPERQRDPDWERDNIIGQQLWEQVP